MKKALWVAVAAVVAAMALAAIVHAPPVRRYALDRAVAMLQSRYGIRLHAGSLSYNLFALRVSLRDVRLAAAHASDTPFLTATAIAIDLPSSAVFGPFTIESLEIDDGRLAIVLAADGTTNLPRGAGAAGEPDALRLGSFVARDLTVDVDHRGSGTRLLLPVNVSIARDQGRLTLREAGRLSRGSRVTSVRRLEGGLTFDGRRVQLQGLTLATDEATVKADGELAVLVAEPGANLRVDAQGEVAQLARWADLQDPPRGLIGVRGTLEGAFANMVAELELRSSSLAWRSMTLGDVSADLRVDADAASVRRLDARFADGTVNAVGGVDWTPGSVSAQIRWTDLDLAALTRAVAPESTVQPSGRMSGGLLVKGPSDNPSRWHGRIDTQVRGAAVPQSDVGVEGKIAATFDNGTWTLTTSGPLAVDALRVRPALNGRIDFDNVERTSIRGRIDLLPATVGDVVSTLAHAGIATVDADGLEGTIAAQATVSGTVGRPLVRARGTAQIVDTAPLAPGTPLGGPAAVTFDADLRTASITATLTDLAAKAVATIGLSAPYATKGEITVDDLALERALRGVETPAPVTGTVTARVRFEGTIDDWQGGRAEIDVESLAARVEKLPVRLASPGRASIANRVATISSLDLFAGETRIFTSGVLPLDEKARAVGAAEALQVVATGDVAQFLNAAAASGMVTLPDVRGTGPAALLARVSGSLERPEVVGNVELGPGTVQAFDYPAATNVTIRGHADGNWIELRELTAEWQGSRVSAHGRAPLAWTGMAGSAPPAGSGSLDARLESLTPRVLEPFLEADTLAQVDGSIDATLHVESPGLDLEQVTGEVRLDRMALRVAELPIEQREPTRVAIRNGFAEVQAWQWAGQGGTAGVQGRVRLSDFQAALLADGAFDLRILTPFTRDAGMTVAGRLEPRLSVTGPLDNPRIDGVARIATGEIRLADPRVVATDLDGTIVLTRNRAQVTRLTGRVNGGAMTASGSIDYEPAAAVEAALRVAIDNMALEFPAGLHSELAVDVGLTATVPPGENQPPSGRVTGQVTVLRGAYREPIALAAGILSGLRTRQIAAELAQAEPSLVDNLALDVRLVTEEDLLVDNNLGRLGLGADLRVIGTVAAPALAGRALLAPGGELYIARNRYEIDSGSIDFVNPVEIEPTLNVTATTRAGGEDIELTITGTPESPEIAMKSLTNPDLGQAEVVSLLLTGRRLEEIGGDEAEFVTEQALAYLSGDVLAFAGRAVGLDTIRLGGVEDTSRSGDPFAVATEVDPTARLTFGKSIGRDLDVIFSQGLRDGDAQTWIVDYRPYRQIETRLISNDENLRSYEFRHDVTFGGASLAGTPAAQRRARREQRVGSITVSGMQLVPEARLRRALDLEEGDRFTFGDWQRDRDRLLDVLHGEGFYEARVSARVDGEDTVTLAYTIAEGPRGAIEIAGHDVSAATRARLQQAWSEAVFDEFLAQEATELVMRELHQAGYLAPRVTTSFAAADGRKTMRIQVEPGTRAASRRVQFEGVTGALEADLRDWASATDAGARVTEDPGAFERSLTAWLRARGHVRSRVTIGAPTMEGTEAIVPVTVDAGPVVTIADVRVEGATQLPAETAMQAVALPAGTPYDPVVVDAARDRLQTRYRREGFSSARVDLRVSTDENAATTAVTFVIAEGPRQVLRDVTVTGNRAIDPDVITRALALPVGEPVRMDDWLQARQRVFNTGLFRRVDVTPEPTEAASNQPAEQPMRARVSVQEWPALRLRYGFQVAEERPEGEVSGRDLVPGLSADIMRRTIFGRAVTLGAALDVQRREQSGRAFAQSRTMLGLPIESSLTLERSREEFAAATLVTSMTSASWEQRVRARRDLTFSYAYRYERNHTFDTEADPDDEFAFDLTVTVAALNTSAAWDTRDNVADTTRGWLLSSSFDWAPAGLGSDFRFLKHLAQAYYFHPWRSLVFASAARIGTAAPLGGQDLAPSERYFAGGTRTVRAVDEDTLGPRTIGGDPAGGESLLVLNQEVRFPIYRWLRGVGFLDAGNVFADAGGIRLGDLVPAYGGGVRLTTPFALFRADYARLFDARAGLARARFTFGIGQAF